MEIKIRIGMVEVRHIPMDLDPSHPGGKWIWVKVFRLIKLKFGTDKDLKAG